MFKINGELIKEALEGLKTPASAKDVINFIADAHKLNEKEIRGPVKDTLTVGLNFGFLQKKNNKFSWQDNRKIMTAKMSAARKSQGRSKSKGRRGRSRRKSNAQSEGEAVGNTPTRKRGRGSRKSRSGSKSQGQSKTRSRSRNSKC